MHDLNIFGSNPKRCIHLLKLTEHWCNYWQQGKRRQKYTCETLHTGGLPKFPPLLPLRDHRTTNSIRADPPQSNSKQRPLEQAVYSSSPGYPPKDPNPYQYFTKQQQCLGITHYPKWE